MMKKLISYILVFAICFTFVSPMIANAKTLKEYKKELAALKSKQDQNNKITQSTINEIDSKRNSITEANKNIEKNEQDIELSKEKIIESEELIKETTSNLYDVLNYRQLVDEENVYLEFLINSNSISEFIERKVIVEQITKYQNDKISGLEQLIKDNQTLQETLTNQSKELEKNISDYESKIEELNKYLSKVTTIGLDYDEQIKAQEEAIKTYQNAGCTDNDDIDYCFYNKYLTSSKFIRPLVSGKITQAYGNNGHKGMDIGGNAQGTAMYAAASGVVIYVSNKSSCGGNIVYIHHNINGVAYTTEYAHMLNVYVKKGDTVNPTTKIGTVGGGPSTWYYDKCTTGAHLHYAVAMGHYLGASKNGYSSYKTFQQKTTATTNEKITGIKNVRGYSWKSRY